MREDGMTDNDNDAPPEETSVAPEDEINALKSEIAALKDRALRAMADADNVRKRSERERQEATQYAVTKFARDLLSVADNLTRAIAAMSGDARESADDSVKGVIAGVEATERELQATLQRHGVKQIQAQGARFDPHLHQAIAEVPGSGQLPGTIVDVVQTGYIIGDRLLRPSMVTVAKAEGASSGNGRVDTKI